MGWYNYNPKDVVRIYEDRDFIVDYNKSGKMYRVSIFEDDHFKDEFWFDCYEEKEANQKDVAQPVKRFDDYYETIHPCWWAGYCPRCNEIIKYDFVGNDKKQYCPRCGQLCDFTHI